MARTEKGIYYQDNYEAEGDILADMKQMAESIDSVIESGAEGQNGLSAYEIAVKNGYIGTEEEWLESLNGADGRDGVDGTDGKDGENGTNGEDGADGKSAYELAVQNGFEGTEQEWLESLKNVYDDTELKNKITEIENTIGNIDTILDNINGEVV